LKCLEQQRWQEELLNNRWPHINEEIAHRKSLVVRNDTEQRNLGSLAYNIKGKWGNQAKKAERVWGTGIRIRLYVGSKGYKQHGQEKNFSDHSK
jgi:hypothetical protein